jgi:hypothetical protein
MNELTPVNPHKEEDEGYVAAEQGRDVSANPYPKGTIRHKEWRVGWQSRHDNQRERDNDGFRAAEAGVPLTENPHPRGTIRYDQWRRGWQIKNADIQRCQRLNLVTQTSDDA